jgi:Predicted transcriptional regulators
LNEYVCKCGRKFKKSTDVGTTGYRLNGYGAEHECFGCPFIIPIKEWDCDTNTNKISAHECRGSKYIRYYSNAQLHVNDKCVGSIYSLDFKFLEQVKKFASTLEGLNIPAGALIDNRAADYGDDGRYRLTVYPDQNKKGIAAKKALLERFFREDGNRQDVSPEQEKQIVLKQIEEATGMGKLNIGNIAAGLDKVKTVTETLSNVSHFELVPIDYIEPADHNPFADEDTDQSRYEVAMSILANGLIEPLAVNKKAADKYKLISGEHRYSAIKQYLSDKFKNIPCMVFEGISDDEAELKLYEANSHREYTSEQKFRRYQELEQLLRKMKDAGTYHGSIQKGLAERLNVSTRQVRKYQTIEKLTPEQQQAVINGEVSINNACKTAAPEPDPQPSETEEEMHSDDALPKSGTSSAFSESGTPHMFKHHDKTFFIQPDETNPNKYAAYFKIGDSEEIRLGSIPDSFDSFAEAQAALDSYAALHGYEEYEEEQSTGIPSAPVEQDTAPQESGSDTEWDERIRIAIKSHYALKRLYSYYLFEVPTTQEAIRDILKPKYGFSGGTISFPGNVTGYCSSRPAQIEVEYGSERKSFTYSQVDEYVRKMIRSGELLSADEIKSVITKHLKGGM